MTSLGRQANESLESPICERCRYVCLALPRMKDKMLRGVAPPECLPDAVVNEALGSRSQSLPNNLIRMCFGPRLDTHIFPIFFIITKASPSQI